MAAYTQAIVKRLLEQHAECDEDEREDLLVLRAAADIVTAVQRAPKERKRGGSLPGMQPNIDRDHAAGHVRLMADYFAPILIHPAHKFRMSHSVFDRLLHGAVARDRYFVQKPGATCKMGLSPYQEVTAALRMYCYGVAADSVDEYVRIGESTAQENANRLYKVIIEEFGDEYLRQPTEADIVRHTRINSRRGFPGMFGSLDCTHWTWKNCPTAWRGVFQDRSGTASIVMEGVATSNLWIWHSYIGAAGSNNDINIVDRSPFIVTWLQGHAPAHQFTVNDHEYETYYLLCDGIYPRWRVFVKTIANPSTEKEKWYAKKQEAIRKDAERRFGVLQGRFAILTTPARSCSHHWLCETWKALVILHNMIIEDEELFDEDPDRGLDPVVVASAVREPMEFDRLLMEMARMRDVTAHTALQNDLVVHLWQTKQQHEDFLNV